MVINHINNKDLCEISQYLPLDILETDFINHIKHLIPFSKNRKIHTLYTRPILNFKESKLVDITLNLDLPENELIAYVKKLKSEYSNEKTKITNLT